MVGSGFLKLSNKINTNNDNNHTSSQEASSFNKSSIVTVISFQKQRENTTNIIYVLSFLIKL